MTDHTRHDEDRTKQIFTESKKIVLSPPPFMKSRILIHVEGGKLESNARLWKRLALISPIAVAAVIFLAFLVWQPSYNVLMNEHVLVKVEVRQAKGMDISYAEIDLPDGVTFYSNRYPEVMDKRSLTLSIAQIPERFYIPFVIESNTPGKKVVRVKFYNSQDSLINEKSISIKFKNNV